MTHVHWRTNLSVVAVTLGAAGVGVALFAPSGPAVRKDGPLATDAGTARQSRGIPADAGRALSFSQIFLINEGDEAVLLEDVIPVDPDPGIRIVGLPRGPRARRLGAGRVFPTFPPTLSGAQLERGPVLPDPRACRRLCRPAGNEQ